MIFDVLVVGETPAAMISAALLVRKKLKVAWVVSPAYLSGESERAGTLVTPDVTWDLLPRVLVREILHRLGVPYKHLEKEDQKGVGLQLVTPELRTFSLDGVEEFKSELKRLFDLAEGDVNRIVQEEPEESAREFLGRIWGGFHHGAAAGKKRTLPHLPMGEGIAPHPFSLEGVRLEPKLKRLLEMTAFSQSYLSQWVFPRSLMRHFINNLCHLNLFAQGRLVSPDRIFREVFHMGGGEFFPGDPDMRVEAHREKGVSLWLNPGEILNGTVCLIAVSPAEAPECFKDFHVSRRSFERGEGSDGVGMANIVFSMDATGIPGGMGDNLILYTGGAADPFHPLHLAFLSLESVESERIEGHYTVFSPDDPEKSDAKGWILAQIRRLEDLFPFMTSHIEVKEWYRSEGHPLCLGRYFYGETRKRRWGVPYVKEGGLGRNIRYIGRRQFDYLGLEGEVLTGLRGADWAVERLAKV